MMTQNQRINAQKDELINRLSWNRGFGCYNKAGFAEMKWPEIAHIAKWIVYFDVDGVHEINEEHQTYDVFNAMMKDVLSKLRSTDIIAGQYNSGDEFLICITEQQGEWISEQRKAMVPEKLVERLTEELARHGLTALFEIQEVKSLLLEDSVKPAADRVLAAKKAKGISR